MQNVRSSEAGILVLNWVKQSFSLGVLLKLLTFPGNQGRAFWVLEFPYIFLYADEQVYARILHFIWKHRDLYSKIIPIMSGFHQLRVLQRVLLKRHKCLAIYKNGLLVPKTFILDQLVKCLKGDIITVQCAYIRRIWCSCSKKSRRYYEWI